MTLLPAVAEYDPYVLKDLFPCHIGTINLITFLQTHAAEDLRLRLWIKPSKQYKSEVHYCAYTWSLYLCRQLRACRIYYKKGGSKPPLSNLHLNSRWRTLIPSKVLRPYVRFGMQFKDKYFLTWIKNDNFFRSIDLSQGSPSVNVLLSELFFFPAIGYSRVKISMFWNKFRNIRVVSQL